jgi:hypothetical protein
MFGILLPFSINYFPGFSYAKQTFNQETTEKVKRIEQEYLKDKEKKIIRVNNDYKLQSGQVVEQNVVVINGYGRIYGELRGSIIVVNGDLKIETNGIISENATVINGNIKIEQDGKILGDVQVINGELKSPTSVSIKGVTTITEKDSFKIKERRIYQWEHKKYFAVDGKNLGKIQYNRVEGIFIGIPFSHEDKGTFINLELQAGYGFKSEKWRYNASLERRFHLFGKPYTGIGVKGYDLTDSDDFWRLGKKDNTLAAFVINEDFFDYYNRRGASVFINQEILTKSYFQIEYRSDFYISMTNKTDWSLFGKHKTFRMNPPVTEGEMHSINYTVITDTKGTASKGLSGWLVQLTGEYARENLGSNFDFERYIADIRRYQPLTRYENLNFRVVLGSSYGNLPVQRLFYLGGIGTLRGMRYKEYIGTSMFLANAEYLISPDRIVPLHFFPHNHKLALFFDAGTVANANIKEYFEKITDQRIKHNAGIGIVSEDQDFRIDFAWRTDQKSRPLQITMRLSRPF